jgi:hypothetical protein
MTNASVVEEPEVGFDYKRRGGAFPRPQSEVEATTNWVHTFWPIFYSSHGLTWHKPLILFGVG